MACPDLRSSGAPGWGAAAGALPAALGAAAATMAVAPAAGAAAADGAAADVAGSLKLAPDRLAMYTTPRRTSMSVRFWSPPLGGMPLLVPLSAFATSASTPSLMWGDHAALSPTFGAPTRPAS